MSDVTVEIPQRVESNAEGSINTASKVVEKRLQKLSPDKKESVGRFIGGGRLTRFLTTLAILISTSCGNVEKPDVNYPPVVVTPIVRTEPTSTPPKTPEKRVLPKDIIPASELEQKFNTRVWNLPNIKLHIRRAAVDNEQILKDLAAGKLPGGLDIVLMDGPFVHTSFLTQEQRNNLPTLIDYLEPKEKIDEEQRRRDFEKNKPAMIQEFKTETVQLEEDLKNGKINQDYFNVQKELIKEAFKPYLEGPTKYEFIGNRYSGMYVTTLDNKKDSLTGEQKFVPRIYILLAVGKSIGEEKVFQSGQVTGKISSGMGVTPLDPKQSYPSPESYYIIKPGLGQDEYPVGAQTQGFTLRHEFSHRVAAHPQTDWVALEKIKQAYEAYQKGDDTLYYFVFETLEGNIFTKRPQPVKEIEGI